VAYAGTAFFAAFAFDRRVRALIGLIALAGVLEIGQLWMPGRTSQVIDFVASSCGAMVGMALGSWWLRSVRG
jgi:VanZ family protein